jgi:hypothetical protein
LPLAPRIRIACAALAVAVIVVLLVVRLRGRTARRDSTRVAGVYDRAERIRRDRDAARRKY